MKGSKGEKGAKGEVGQKGQNGTEGARVRIKCMTITRVVFSQFLCLGTQRK